MCVVKRIQISHAKIVEYIYVLFIYRIYDFFTFFVLFLNAFIT